ncbi:WecB/TagA/CpsF family glycosyltransferase [Blastococcus sp. SYSU DS0533]
MAASFSGVPLWTGDMDRAVHLVLRTALAKSATSFRLINAYTLYCASSSPSYTRLLTGEGVNFIDGKPLSAYLRRRGHSDAEQVRGPDLFERCLDAGRAEGVRHFFFGGDADLLARLEQRIASRYPGVEVVGTYAPPFREFDDADRAEFARVVSAAAPHIVWVAIGTPRQDVEAVHLARATGCTTVAVGAAFDFSAGRKAAAPAFLSRMGLEWAFRLLEEPGRLWRRYLYGNVHFLLRALRDWRGR